MSEIKAIEKLRELLKCCGCSDECYSCRISYEGREVIDAIEAEIADRYMQLPVDADGVPIHMGDIVEGELLLGSTVKGTVCAFHLYDDEPASVYIKVNLQGGWTIKELRIASCRHAKPRTVEDVLREFVHEHCSNGELPAYGNPVYSEYADKLREMLWSDAE